MATTRPLRDVFTEVSGDAGARAADPADLLAANGHTDLPDELVAEAVVNFADTAPIEVAEHLSEYVMAHSPVPSGDPAAEVDPSSWLDTLSCLDTLSTAAPVAPPDDAGSDPTDSLDLETAAAAPVAGDDPALAGHVGHDRGGDDGGGDDRGGNDGGDIDFGAGLDESAPRSGLDLPHDADSLAQVPHGGDLGFDPASIDRLAGDEADTAAAQGGAASGGGTDLDASDDAPADTDPGIGPG